MGQVSRHAGYASQKMGLMYIRNGICLCFSFKLTYLHLCSTLCSLPSKSLPSTSYPTTKMSSAIPNTLGKCLNILSVFLWNISPVGATPNSNCLYLSLPNWHGNVARYDVLSSSFRLRYPKLTPIRERYCTLFSLVKYH